MNTAVNPIDGEHSIEDGVYLRHLDKMDDDNWPTATAVHQWLVNAAQGHATENLMDNRACVRVRYSGQYCIDLYAYGELNGQRLLVAETGKKWTRGDPPAITRWFESYVHQRGGQLQRIVRYLKAWADHQSLQHCEMTDGLLPIVLSVYHFRAHKRDDIALAKTVEAISDTIRTEFFVLNPVDISEELTARFTTAQKETIKDAIEVFADCANGALAVQGEYKASRLWRKQLGDRFPFRYREE